MAFLFTCFTCTKPGRKQRELESVGEADDHDKREKSRESSDQRDGIILGRLSWDEIRRHTSNFSSLIGSGGFSNVYLAQFPGMGVGAVKILSCCSERLSGIYKQELRILRGLRHDRIVKLLGYCDNGGMSWRSRVKIALQLAQALEYLHHQCPLQILHGDIKASNILLDHHLDIKLCDFGSAKMGFSSAVMPPQSSSSHNHRRMMMTGSPGYTDPHYLWTGIASKKNDIYSFGVILLELITGMEAHNPVSGKRLASAAGPVLRDPSKVARMVDARLFEQDTEGLDLEEVKAMASISVMCLSETPSLRPSASDIVSLMTDSMQIPDSPRVSFSMSKTNRQQ